MTSNIQSSAAKLTDRDIEILRLAAEGKTQAEMARILFITFEAVKKRSNALRTKLDSPTIANAIYKAVQAGQLD